MSQLDPSSTIIEQLVALLKAHTDAPITAETDLVNDLALESVQIMAYVTDVEDHFDIAIELESLASVHQLGELAPIVEKALQQA